VSEQDRAPSPRVGRRRWRAGARVYEMVFEIGELDNSSESTRLAGRVGDPLHVGAVVVFLGAGQERKRAELSGAHPLDAQLVDSQGRTLRDVVKPRCHPRAFGDRGRDASDVLELRATRGCLLPVVSTLGDRTRRRFSHERVPDVIKTLVANELASALPVWLAMGARRPPRSPAPASS
jgi:hypothetical protein